MGESGGEDSGRDQCSTLQSGTGTVDISVEWEMDGPDGVVDSKLNRIVFR